MPWSYRSPSIFPARFPQAIRAAAAKPSTPILLHSGDPATLASDAENFRYYRWCVRQRPDYDRALASMLSAFTFRVSTEAPGFSPLHLLYVTAKPAKLSELATLNPHLSELFI